MFRCPLAATGCSSVHNHQGKRTGRARHWEALVSLLPLGTEAHGLQLPEIWLGTTIDDDAAVGISEGGMIALFLFLGLHGVNVEVGMQKGLEIHMPRM
ncbi:hypothetical protein D3C86_1822250 [compost metagenome]